MCFQYYLFIKQRPFKDTTEYYISTYNFLKSTFKTTEQRLKASGIDYSNSGTCCISVMVIKNVVYVANLGDSRAVLYRKTHKDKLAIEMSYD